MADSAHTRDTIPRLPLRVYIGFGLRNLARNRLRTLLSLSSLLIGIGVVTFLGALTDGWLQGMHDNFTLTYTGHLQVQAPGHVDSNSLADAISDPSPVIRVLEKDPHVQAWSLRLEASGLASAAQGSTGVTLLGISPDSEQRTSRLLELVDNQDCLRKESGKDLVLGADAAITLGARPGDRLVLMGQTPGGELVSELFHLCGILRSGAPQLDRVLAMIPLRTAQRWLQLGDGVTQLVVRVGDERNLPALTATLRERLPANRFRILEWQTLEPMAWQWLRFGALYGLIILGIVVALVVIQVSNTLLMALYERQHEFAIMEALGTRRRQLFLMVAWESLLLITLGGGAGYLVGALAVALAVQAGGIDFSQFSGAFHFFFMDPVVIPRLTREMGLKIAMALLAAILLGGLYPAWKASRLEPLASLQ